MTQPKLWIGLLILFLAGMLTGTVGTTLYWQYEQNHQSERGPAARQERVMKKLIHELSLDPAQQATIKPIVERTYKNLLELRFRHQPEVEQILAQGMTDMKAALGPEQRTKLDGLYARLRGRWNQSREFLSAASTEDKGPHKGGQP